MSNQATPLFEVKDLRVSIEDKEIIKGISLKIMPGEIHAIMGKNGSGKTTLSYALMGHPEYTIDSGSVFLNGEDITEMDPEERAKKRLFLAFQYPTAIPGVSVGNFLKTSLKNIRGEDFKGAELRKAIKSMAKEMDVPESFLGRSLNDGFSGGEKKKLETLQMKLLDPVMSIMDETDSGLDIDALKLVAEKIDGMRDPKRAILLITHYQRLLNHVKPDVVHVMIDGQIVKSGDASLALELEEKGYDLTLNPQA